MTIPAPKLHISDLSWGGGFESPVMHNHPYLKLTGITLVAIMVAGGLTFAISGTMPEAYAVNANLFVSAENPQFNNHVAGPQIVEIVIIDNNLADIDEAVGEPDVTVNGSDLRMVQATDGNWYAYMADHDQVVIASMNNNGLDYNNTEFADDPGEDMPDRSFGHLGIRLTGADGYTFGSNDVIREPKEINDNAAELGQIGLNDPANWPFIQLYELNPTGNFVIQYNKAGGAQTTTLTFDDVDSFAGITLDRTKYSHGAQVHATITDAWLNIDPTDEDSWTFDARDGTMYYQVFDENGATVNDDIASIDGATLMCGDGCDLRFDPDAQNTDTPVMELQPNSNVDRALNPTVLGLDGNGLTITEAGPNTGIFTTYDEQDDSVLVITDDAQRGTSATINYADTPQSILVGFDFAKIDIELQDDAWNSGESIPIILMDQDLNKNSRADEDITLSDPTYDIIPTLRTGTPLTLAAGVNADGELTGTFNGEPVTISVDDVSDVGRITLDPADAEPITISVDYVSGAGTITLAARVSADGQLSGTFNGEPVTISVDDVSEAGRITLHREDLPPGSQEDALIHVEGPSISIVTEKSTFKQGEVVRIKLVNTGTVTLFYPDISYGLSIQDSDGTYILSDSPGQAEVVLEPGEEADLGWDQRESNTGQVPAGTYTISVEMRSGQGPAQTSTTITIEG